MNVGDRNTSRAERAISSATPTAPSPGRVPSSAYPPSALDAAGLGGQLPRSTLVRSYAAQLLARSLLGADAEGHRNRYLVQGAALIRQTERLLQRLPWDPDRARPIEALLRVGDAVYAMRGAYREFSPPLLRAPEPFLFRGSFALESFARKLHVLAFDASMRGIEVDPALEMMTGNVLATLEGSDTDKAAALVAHVQRLKTSAEARLPARR